MKVYYHTNLHNGLPVAFDTDQSCVRLAHLFAMLYIYCLSCMYDHICTDFCYSSLCL